MRSRPWRSRLAPTSKAGVPGLRWWIAGLIFLATIINFVNRLTISVLAPVITTELHLRASQVAGVDGPHFRAWAVQPGLLPLRAGAGRSGQLAGRRQSDRAVVPGAAARARHGYF